MRQKHHFRTRGAQTQAKTRYWYLLVAFYFRHPTSQAEKRSYRHLLAFSLRLSKSAAYGASQGQDFFQYYNGITRYVLQRGEARKRFHLNGTNILSERRKAGCPRNTRNMQSHLPVGQHRIGLYHSSYGTTERDDEAHRSTVRVRTIDTWWVLTFR